MKSASFLKRLSFAGPLAAVLMAGGLAGCGTEIISYNRQFREQGMGQYTSADYPAAAGSFENAIRQEPGDYTSHYYLGQCYEKMNKPQQAIQQYRTTLTVMEHSLEGKTDSQFRSNVVEALARVVASEPDRSGDLAALEAQPRTAENALLLAEIYKQTGDADNAMIRFEQAQQIDPQNPQIAKEYGLYLEQLGQTARADRQLRRAYTLNDKDEEVAAALRRLGIVPGPSLKSEDALAKPALPLGPLPEVDLSTSSKPQAPAPNTNGVVGTSTSPRD